MILCLQSHGWSSIKYHMELFHWSNAKARFCFACQCNPENKEWYYSIYTRMNQKLMKLDERDILSNS